nr:MAG TPA: hypothetical protein [Caudoviricetes sp.]
MISLPFFTIGRLSWRCLDYVLTWNPTLTN